MRTLKQWFLCLAGIALLAFTPCHADVPVKGYYRKDGTYVAPYVRTSPNGTKNDNYSTKGNLNPHTGKEGTKPGDSRYTNHSHATYSLQGQYCHAYATG